MHRILKKNIDIQGINIQNSPSFIEINDQLKLRLNISTFAKSVIDNDVFTSGFSDNKKFNTIFQNMCKYYIDNDHESDDVFVFETYKNALDRLRSITDDEEAIKKELKTVEERLENYAENLLSYPGEYKKTIIINTDNYKYLIEECREAVFYGEYRMALFFRCVIESYARKTHLEREKIMTDEFLKEINSSINESKQLKIKTGKKTRNQQKTYLAKPYKVMTDPLATSLYLVCLSKEYNSDEEDYKIASFRISNIDETEKTKMNSFISSDKKTDIEAEIKKRGVNYMLSDSDCIEVLLTKGGYNLYKAVLFNRPIAAETENMADGGKKMRFECTQKQAEDYFLRFGENAEIISPPELREKFIESYKKAIERYIL